MPAFRWTWRNVTPSAIKSTTSVTSKSLELAILDKATDVIQGIEAAHEPDGSEVISQIL